MTYAIITAICFFASCVGSIIGIGGGVIIKPVLDAMGIMSVAVISFLSGITVLCMSTYSVARNTITKSVKLDLPVAAAVSIGAAVGGIIGKLGFSQIASMFPDANRIGAVQAICLLVLTAITLVYTIFKDRIKKLEVRNKAVSAAAGLFLGIVSSFLGIGGGPINIMLLSWLFSFDSKTAAAYSLFIIMWSQIASLIFQLASHTIPEFSPSLLVLMSVCGILGGAAGGMVNKKIKANGVDKLFEVMLAVIMGICVFNFVKYIR